MRLFEVLHVRRLVAEAFQITVQVLKCAFLEMDEGRNKGWNAVCISKVSFILHSPRPLRVAADSLAPAPTPLS